MSEFGTAEVVNAYFRANRRQR